MTRVNTGQFGQHPIPRRMPEVEIEDSFPREARIDADRHRPIYRPLPPEPPDEGIEIIDLDSQRIQVKPNTWGVRPVCRSWDPRRKG